MQAQLEAIVDAVHSKIASLTTRSEFEAFKSTVSGPKGSLTLVAKGMGKVPKEERPVLGKLINEAKQKVEACWAEALVRIEENELRGQLGAAVDPTLPSPDLPHTAKHPLTQIREEINAVFRKIGFTVAEGSELETEWFCFDALNTPEDHPARDAQDTLFMPESVQSANVGKHASERYILRTHTSTVQVRTLLKENPPVRIIAPGRVFRRDTVDATHSANFHQLEGLYVNRRVTVQDLKAVLDYFVRAVFGKGAKTRLRPSFFPFTEPSFEMDVMSPNLGKLSNEWIEVMGCGMVDPQVLQNVNLDPEEWSGYAFGMGIERIAMIVHGIDDIRHFYSSDVRFLRQFR